MRATILVCTHNLVPKKLFIKVLEDCVFKQARIWDCDVVVVSHYPVLNNYIEEDLTRIEKMNHEQFKNVILKNSIVHCDSFCDVSCVTNIVVGERAYSVETLCDQMALGLKYSKADNVVVMEHDVLYPDSYVDYMSKALDNGTSFCCWKNGVVLSSNGFFETPGWVMFSRFAWKKSFLIKYLASMEEFKSTVLEPIIMSASLGNTGETYWDYEAYGLKAKYTTVEDSTGIGNDVLDVRHGLNSSGNIVVEKYYDEHPKWGNKNLWSDLVNIEFTDVASEKLSYAYGLMD